MLQCCFCSSVEGLLSEGIVLQEVFSAMKRGENPSGYCHSCVLRKPQRSKHCGDLDKCVERFDHYV
jgi:hypothetical protein